MNSDRKAQQLVEYLLLFAVVVITIFAVSTGIGEKVSGVLGDTLGGLNNTYTYSWVRESCSACSGSCGGAGTQTCTFVCERNDGKTASDSKCVDIPKPPAAQSCVPSCPPVDCVWGSWQDPGEDACQPPCGTNRTRIETRSIATPAQYGGADCTGPSSREVACANLPCDAVCGNGVVEFGEQCDGGNLGSYSSNCVDLTMGQAYVGGTVSCDDECKLDISQCEYEPPCEDWIIGECEVDGCLPGERSETQNCERVTVAGTVVDTFQNTRCVTDPLCSYQCEQMNGMATPCPGWNQGLIQNDQSWVYLEGSASCPESAPCTAKCPDVPNMIASSSGCNCDWSNYWNWNGSACEQCVPPWRWNGSKCVLDGGWECSPWSACSKTCGGGQQTRTCTCTNPIPQNGGIDCVDNVMILQPELSQTCNTQPCATYEWQVGGWGSCDKNCGTGKQWREVKCVVKDENGCGFTLDSRCDRSSKPADNQTCNAGSCCGSTKSHTVRCGNVTRAMYPYACSYGDRDGNSWDTDMCSATPFLGWNEYFKNMTVQIPPSYDPDSCRCRSSSAELSFSGYYSDDFGAGYSYATLRTRDGCKGTFRLQYTICIKMANAYSTPPPLLFCR